MSLYECLTGEVPYSGPYPEVLVQVSNAAGPPDVRAKRPDVPPALAIVIENALEKDATARFQSAAELGRALVAASGLELGPSALLSLSADEEMAVDVAVEDDEEPARTIQLVRRKDAPTPIGRARPGVSARRTVDSTSARLTSPRCGSSRRRAARSTPAARR